MRVDGPHPGEEWNDGAVTEPRQAASIVVLRDSAEGPEVLLVQRNPEQRFMGGAWVFPGGAVHSDDSDHAAAAVRELAEEAGVELAADNPIVGWSRWITPAEVVVRFDTWFFVAEAPPGAEATVDGAECVDARWLRPAAALESHERGAGRDGLGRRGAREGAHARGGPRAAARRRARGKAGDPAPRRPRLRPGVSATKPGERCS